MADGNRTSEQLARDAIDAKLEQAGWRVQAKNAIDFNAGPGIAVREYQTDVGPADYLLFVDRKPVGIIEAKPEEWGRKITVVEEQSAGYADAGLKWLNSAEPRPFVYESTGTLTRFTDRRDPQPRSREVFSFHRRRPSRNGSRNRRRCARGSGDCRRLAPRDCAPANSTRSPASKHRSRPTIRAR